MLAKANATAAAAVTVVALAGLLSGCYPHSHKYVLTPEFSGVLLKDGAPMPGVTVTVSHTAGGDTGNYCVNPETVAVTSETGAFRVPPQASVHQFSSILNPPSTGLQMTSICFQALGKLKLGVFVIAQTDHVERYETVCDWNSPGVEFRQNVQPNRDQQGICKRHDGT